MRNDQTAVTWDDIKPGAIIRYRHLSRSRRLANRPLNIRRGRVERVNRGLATPQISVTVLNKDGNPNASLGRVTVFGLDYVESVEQAAPATRPSVSEGGADRG